MYRKPIAGGNHGRKEGAAERLSILGRISAAYNRRREWAFEGFQNTYGQVLQVALAHGVFTLVVALLIALARLPLIAIVGEDFFPSVDAGLMKLHFRAPVGTPSRKPRNWFFKRRTGFAEPFRPTSWNRSMIW